MKFVYLEDAKMFVNLAHVVCIRNLAAIRSEKEPWEMTLSALTAGDHESVSWDYSITEADCKSLRNAFTS